MNEKKRRELHYLEEARRASPIFPTGDFVPDDPLDFVVSLGTGAGTLGIEVTELCQRETRAKAARLGNVTPKAQGLYCARRNAEPVDVTALFSQRAHELYIDDLAGALADFVYEHRASDRGRFSTQLPDGFCQIGVCPALHVPGGGEWQYFREFEVRYALRPLIDSRITDRRGLVR